MRRITVATILALSLLLGCDSNNSDPKEDASADVTGDTAQPQCMADSDCPDQDFCRPGACVDGVCGVQELTGSCDDQNPCTENDMCTQGYCVGAPKTCDNQLWCDGEESCDPVSGECLAGVVPSEDDGVACTAESCDEEVDKILHTPDHTGCADTNPCTQDYCDLAAGCLSLGVEGLDCNDEDLCTVQDKCDAKGACKGAAMVCDDELFCNGASACDPATGQCLDTILELNLDDGIDCTVDLCDEATKSILHTPSDAFCDDNNPCTEDSCSVAAGGCIWADKSIACDDGIDCTTGDFCLNGFCLGTPDPLACDDGDGCTEDTCSVEAEGCLHLVSDCDSQACFYHAQCGSFEGSWCGEPTPLNYGEALALDAEFSRMFVFSPAQNLTSPLCVSSDDDGPEQWFQFSLAQQSKVTLSVDAEATQIAASLFHAPCQGDSMFCQFQAPSAGPFDLGVLEAGEYSLIVDVVGGPEVTVTITTSAP